MKEGFFSKEMVRELISDLDRNDLKRMFQVVEATALRNADFALAAEDQEYFLWKLNEAGAADSRLQASDILSPEDRDVYQGLKKLHEMKSPRSRSFVDALSFMYTSGALLEGALLMSSDGMEDLTIKAFEVTGGPERLNAIVRDPVYQKRRKYVCRLREYIHAIVNLYGVTDLEEILNIVQDTEKSFRDHTGYTRKEGGYRNTLYYSPRYLSMGTLEKFIQSAVRDVLVTMDGLVLHGCFVESYAEEVQKLAEMLRSSEKRVTDEQLDAFFDSMADQSYRRLYETAAEKEPYIPSRKILLQYADPEFHEETEAERAFRRFVNGKYAREIAETARKRGTTAAELVDGFLKGLRQEASDHGKEEQDALEVSNLAQIAATSAEDLGIIFEGDDLTEINQWLRMTMECVNSVPLWFNHGHSPAQLRSFRSNQPAGPIKIVPGSGLMASMLEESRDKIEAMGFQVDTESNADVIPTMTFPNGLEGAAKTENRKIYPNDPCPCGSGKKYKKCHGRK